MRKRKRGGSRRDYSLAFEDQPLFTSRQRRVELRMVLQQLFSRDAHIDAIVFCMQVVPIYELVVARRALPSAYMRHFTRYEDPFFSKMSHCANATRSAFVASAGRQMGSSAGSGYESTNCISVTHGSTGRLMPEGKAATQIEPQDRRKIDGSTQYSQAIVRRF